jgi:hypothetical protein
MSDAVDPAVAELLDTKAIVDLTITYTWLLDHGPHADLAQVFTPDAFALLGGTECHGAEAIIDRVDRALSRLTISQHIVANHQVAIDGDEATCRCYFQAQHVLVGTDGGDNYIIAGRYDDRLVRTPDGWRIAHRVLTVDWTEGNRSVVHPTRSAGTEGA